MIRLAKETDVEAIRAIYTPFVESSVVTFDLKVPSLLEFTKKFQKIIEEAPCLVCEIDGEIIGYAFADSYRSKEAYKWTREVSVYINKDKRTNKYGTALYLTLIELLKCQNYRNIVAAITLPNIPSVSFHQRLGFHQCGIFNNIGFKFGKTHRVGWWQLTLVDVTEPAKDIIPLKEVLETEEGQKALKAGELRLNV
ncbi:GNAT family N-acetyltransferase [Aureispira]|nr:GNAT family N-acetyltransferase [Aureispira sp.]